MAKHKTEDRKARPPAKKRRKDEGRERRAAHRDDIRVDDEIVEETSEDSFPGSDPPSYSGGTAGRG